MHIDRSTTTLLQHHRFFGGVVASSAKRARPRPNARPKTRSGRA